MGRSFGLLQFQEMNQTEIPATRPRLKFQWHRKAIPWFCAGLLAWFFLQVWQFHFGIFFSWAVTFKGIPLLAGAAIFYSWVDRSANSWMGFFPLLWLGLSRFQWNLCETMDHRAWLWAILYLVWLLLILAVRDGKKLAFLLSPLWIGLGMVWNSSIPLVLAFLGFSRSRVRAKSWACAAGIICLAILTVSQKAWSHLTWNELGLYEILFQKRIFIFLILGLFGWSILPGRGRERAAASSLFWVTLGYFLWAPFYTPFSVDDQAYGWLLQLWAGVGLEGFRRQVLDKSPASRWVWFIFGVILALAVCPGVFSVHP